MSEQCSEKAHIMGMDIIPDNINNRHVRRAIGKRGGFSRCSEEGTRFVIGHKDHTDEVIHTEAPVLRKYMDPSTGAEERGNDLVHSERGDHIDDTHYDDMGGSVRGWGWT